MEQTPFDPGKIGIVENPEPRCPCVLVLDVSGSMTGEPLKQLQDGLTTYRDGLAADNLAGKRVEVAIVTFGGTVDVVQNFTTAENFTPPVLEAKGDTPMGEAVVTALKLLEDRKAELRQNGLLLFRPWVFLITDGGPTDKDTHFWSEAKALVKQSEEMRKCAFYAVGVEGADMGKLKELSPPGREPLKLQGLSFRKLFVWLSSSQGKVAQSIPGEKVALASPTAPDGWAEV